MTDYNHHCLIVHGLFHRMQRAQPWKRVQILGVLIDLLWIPR